MHFKIFFFFNKKTILVCFSKKVKILTTTKYIKHSKHLGKNTFKPLELTINCKIALLIGMCNGYIKLLFYNKQAILLGLTIRMDVKIKFDQNLSENTLTLTIENFSQI
jgi:hypothetical protein